MADARAQRRAASEEHPTPSKADHAPTGYESATTDRPTVAKPISSEITIAAIAAIDRSRQLLQAIARDQSDSALPIIRPRR
jgi:hypothetical protein